MRDLADQLPEDGEPDAPGRRRQRPAQHVERPQEVLQRLLMLPAPEQRLADLPRQHGLLDRFTAVAESPLVGGYHLAVAPASASASPAMAPAWSAALKRYAWAFSHSSARAK